MDMLHATLMGCAATSMDCIYASKATESSVAELDTKRPHRVRNHSFYRLKFENPGRDFSNMAKDAFQTLQVFLVACDWNNIWATRWNWDYHLLKDLGWLFV